MHSRIQFIYFGRFSVMFGSAELGADRASGIFKLKNCGVRKVSRSTIGAEV